VKQKKDEA
jgi:hypothetical protein